MSAVSLPTRFPLAPSRGEVDPLVVVCCSGNLLHYVGQSTGYWETACKCRGQIARVVSAGEREYRAFCRGCLERGPGA